MSMARPLEAFSGVGDTLEAVVVALEISSDLRGEGEGRGGCGGVGFVGGGRRRRLLRRVVESFG